MTNYKKELPRRTKRRNCEAKRHTQESLTLVDHIKVICRVKNNMEEKKVMEKSIKKELEP